MGLAGGEAEVVSSRSSNLAPPVIEATPAVPDVAPIDAQAAPEKPVAALETPTSAPPVVEAPVASLTSAEADDASQEVVPASSSMPPASSPQAQAEAAQLSEAIAATTPDLPKAGDAAPAARPRLDSRDDSSYPPVDLDNHFFGGAARDSEMDLETDHRDPRLVRKSMPDVVRRRADLQRYVKWAVAGASVLCLAAVVKAGITRSHADEGPRRSLTAAAAIAQPAPEPQAPAAQPSPAEPPAPETQPAAAAPAAVPAETAAPPAETAAPPAEPPAPAAEATPPAAQAAAPGEPPPAAAPAEGAQAAPGDAPPAQPDPVAAAKEKTASRNALERGKNADAIEAGEKSVALDPTDGEAWLILGAAYQAKGDMKNARRSYKACIEQGKRGPRSECMAMPH
jgi:hypothetical protein